MHLTRLSPLLLLACSTQGTSVAVPRVQVPEDDVIFEFVEVESTTHQQLRIVNAGTAPAIAYLSADGSFSPNTPSVELLPQSDAAVSVQFTPTSFEEQAGTLQVRIEDVTVRIALRGTVDPDWDNDGHEDVRANGDDCDDSLAAVHPDAPEVCDGLDNDCNGAVDDQPVDIGTWYVDADDDDFGADEGAVAACTQPDNTAAVGGDCDDTRSDIYPGAVDSADHRDNDCDGFIDDTHISDGQLLVSEVMVHPLAGTPQYVELYSAHPLWVHTVGMSLSLGTDAVALPDALLEPGSDLLLLCGVGAPDEVHGVPCDAALPRAMTATDMVQITAQGTIEAFTWSGWELPDGISVELAPGIARAAENDDEAVWCDSSTVLLGDERGTPGTRVGHCAL